MKKLFLSSLFTLSFSICLFAQWEVPGNSNYSGSNDPRISKSNPHLQLNSTGAYSGIRFFSGGNPDGWLWYDHSNNVLGFSNNQSPTNAALTIDKDNGYLLLRKASSRLGIGTDNPLSAIHIKSAFSADVRLESGSNSNARILFYNAGSQNGMIDQDDEEMHVYNLLPTGIMRLGMDNNDLVILANGNTGIGVFSPSERLELSGAIKVGNTANENVGTIRWTGSVFQGRTNDDWENLTSAWDSNGLDLYRLAGNVGIGVDTPSFKLHVNGNTHIVGELSSTSDRRLKRNITPITNALHTLNQLKPVEYEYRIDEFEKLSLSEGKQMGLIAQDVMEVLPNLVSEAGSIEIDGKKSNYLGVHYLELIPLLIKSVQELNEQIRAKDKVIAQLKSDQEGVANLEERLGRLEAQLIMDNN